MNRAHLLIVLSAPSGAGKTTLCHNLLAVDAQVSRAITCTTRPPRRGEEHGRDYYFLSEDDFTRQIAAGEFLEHALVHGHRYGTLKNEVLRHFEAGRDVLLNIDVQGAATLRQAAAADPRLAASLVTVFLATRSLAELETRLRNRNQDAPEVIQRRLAAARAELAQWKNFDYLILSGTMSEDLQHFQAIVMAERLRTARVQPPPW
ncbi:guanylate kinase [Fontisphaera persica]|uniref:guanylate kinase n=1 Tax=Fontisphaera persica TaxID=2974023 RepID=UPI0024C05F57|nr:guanylate kinase [Fontisphaera persica]WCJ61025.1 guanylate kinase [Fontisphaera persica]